MINFRRTFLLALVCSLALAGCGGGNAKLANDLKVVGLDYHNFHDAHKKGPASWEELLSESKDASAVKRVQDAGYQVKWGVTFASIEGGTANTVLAEKPGGGPKLMMDGAVKQQ